MPLTFGLRAALIMLVLIAIAPVFAVVVQASLSEQKSRLERAESNLKTVVELSAAHQERLVEGARQMLTAIAHSPPVYQDDVQACANYMRKLQVGYPTAFGTFGLIDASGHLTCRATAPATAVVSSDRLFFRTAVETGRFSVGEFTLSRASGRPVLTFGMPVYREDGGALRGVVYVALDVAQADEQLRKLTIPQDMALLVLDAQGVVLAAAGTATLGVGARLPDGFLRQAIAKGAARLERSAPGNGDYWLFALQPVGRPGEARLFVAGLTSHDEVLAPATRRLQQQLTALTVIALFGAAAAWAFGDRVFARPLGRLIKRVNALTREELRLDAPAVGAAGVRELADLDLRFHEMARNLAERSIQRDGAMAEMSHQTTLLESVLSSMAEGVLVIDPQGRFLHVNDAATRILPGLPVLNRQRRPAAAFPSTLGVYETDGKTPIAPEQWPASQALLGRSVENYRYLVHGPLSAGAQKIISGNARPILAPSGQPSGAVVVFTDITAAWHAQESLRESERRYRTLFEANPHPMWVFDVQTKRFLTVNDAAVEHYGYSREQFLAMTISDIRPEQDVEPLDMALATLGALSLPSTWRHRLRDGRLIDVEISSHAMDYDGRPARMVLALDVTLRRSAEEAMRELNETLERRVGERTRELRMANKELESFSYSVSHDLRAPLQAIDGFGRALLTRHSGEMGPQARHYLDRIRENTSHMSGLIDDLLLLARVTRAEISVEPVDLGARAAQIVERLRQRFPDREVTVEIAPDLHAEGDPRLLSIVLENLIENAWKFTGRTDQPRIQIGRAPGAGGEEVFFVSDNGAGFDMAYVNKLFTPFQRLHAVTEFEGTGIGLATVNRVIVRHGGRVWARAVPGGGATFEFSLKGRENDDEEQPDTAG